ncbi:sigma-54-dependent transcriptional regulator [Oceanimonas baumannii]|uniref:Sigma-54-dependent Fis family transcriptional regulator n=1 Tax=Oceanimonas baumannii TaxID=129578 RepID=A0A235CN97_9GAMM|nr:sigma-54 dependent transcriptional regulator [Oceanimonas baumannii]OYD25906.1 sigma-54-dependent Fis family transcriptional regulator [Oceanimonas baumannii]TDW60077.1 two-component system response regulator FlrC [Oceanimonas baumannii]
MMNIDILIVEDDSGLQQALQDTLELAGLTSQCVNSAEEAILYLQQTPVRMVITDVQMAGMNGLELLEWINERLPGLPVLVITAHAQVSGAVTAMRAGAVDYLAKPFTPEALLERVRRYVRPESVDSDDPVAEDVASRQLLQLAARVAVTEASVMISGPSGTGKEVLARFIHARSARATKPFVAINCAAIPDNMLEATLFGYEKGAFTGAVQACPGKFELADEGTLLLDEITEMDVNLQAKLLRVLQEQEVERLGGRKSLRLNVRVLATSNRDLRKAVSEGRFREDLYYRLNVFPLVWPALAERPDDILPLARFLLNRHGAMQGRHGISLSADAEKRLKNWHWPGNVRELDNVMQRALILAGGHQISAGDIFLDDAGPCVAAAPRELGDKLESQEHRIILQALQSSGGSRREVAEQLGISPRTLRYKLARMRDAGIEVPV